MDSHHTDRSRGILLDSTSPGHWVIKPVGTGLLQFIAYTIVVVILYAIDSP